VIHIQSVNKQYGAKVLFEDASARLGHRSRVALIGPNGAGKSTLIRILLQKEEADSGRVIRASHLSIGYLAQDLPRLGGRTVLSEVMRLDGRREELLETQQELEQALSQDPSDTALLERYGRILEEVILLDESRLEARAKQILSGIGFKEPDFHRELHEFSGGWLMRVALARILLMDPDLLLLDEPTNHLDLESLLWLEEFLRRYRGALLMISHDRAFLNRLVDEVWELDQNRLISYRGNLDAYRVQKAERLAMLEAQYEGQQAKISEIERFVTRFGAKATKARQAQSRLKQLEKMDRIELPEARSSIRFRFPPAPESGKEVVSLQNLGMAFGDRLLFKGVNWVLQKGSRVAIVGVNGAGKTTLLKLLTGKAQPTDGRVKLGHGVQVGYYAQLQAESLNLERTILQELEEVAPEMPISQVRGIAGAFLFTGDQVEKKCKVLSGGEKARVALAKLLLSPSNFLILDEPTNHLDIDSKEILLEALKNYSGTLCVVSHDREFISPLVDSVLEVVPGASVSQGSQVIQLLGQYEDYLKKKQSEILEAESETVQSVKQEVTLASKELKGPSNNQKKSWEREKLKIETEISELERRQIELQQILGDVETYQDKARSLQLIEEQKKVEKTLADQMTRWEELSVLLE
jgi:ATP-binding cassette subfamily F protein 3